MASAVQLGSGIDPYLPGNTKPGPSAAVPNGVHRMDSTNPASSSPSASNATITSSDFLTLLVTELKNQDPTTQQDPNAYITQLVQVNSLQQLISINQDLTATGSSTTGTGTGGSTSGNGTTGSSSAAVDPATTTRA